MIRMHDVKQIYFKDLDSHVGLWRICKLAVNWCVGCPAWLNEFPIPKSLIMWYDHEK